MAESLHMIHINEPCITSNELTIKVMENQPVNPSSSGTASKVLRCIADTGVNFCYYYCHPRKLNQLDE